MRIKNRIIPTTSSRKKVLGWVAVAALGLILGCASHNASGGTSKRVGVDPPEAGQAAPAFTVSSIDGREVTVPVPGAVTVIEFLTPFCTSCKKLSADLDRLARQDSYRDVHFLGVVLEADGPAVERLASEENLSFQWTFDLASTIATHYSVRGVPAVYVIDQNGYVVLKTEGTPRDYAQIAGALRRLVDHSG